MSDDLSEDDKHLIRLNCDWMRRRNATERTLHHRRGNLARLAKRLPCPLRAATDRDLELWQARLTVSSSSVATYTSHTRGFYRWALDAGLVEVDPSAKLPMPKIPARLPRPIPERDLALALGCAAEPVRTWLLLAGYMGLRAMEIAQIRRDDFTELDGRLLISGVGKGRKAYRLPVPVHVAPFLSAHLGGRPGPLWRTESGRPVRADDVTNQATQLMRAVGLPHTLHALRHRFGTVFYAATRDLLLTAEVMRHCSVNTTRGYVATGGHQAVAAMDELSRSLRPRRQCRTLRRT